jgi:dTMP kinase
MLIVYEGIDGSGKTTSSGALCTALQAAGHQVTLVQWTSFQPRPEEKKNSLFARVDRKRENGTLGPLAYALWHCADLAYRLEEFVTPAIERGEIVVMDRYKYTAFVRDVIRGIDETMVRSWYRFAPDPDLVIYFDVDPSVAFARKKAGPTPLGHYECGLDIFGNLSEEAGFRAFQSLCARRYPAVLPETTMRLDGTQPKAQLNKVILDAVNARLAR